MRKKSSKIRPNVQTERGYLNKKAFAREVKNMSSRVKGRSSRAVRSIAKALPADQAKFLLRKLPGQSSDLSFIGADSAKVIHSQELGWLNAILYLAPADRAALSFAHYFGPETVQDLLSATRKAAETDRRWKRFGFSSPSRVKKYLDDIKALKEKPFHKDYVLPDLDNRVGALTVCPFASPNCRAVCLNTSGHGGRDKYEKMANLIREKDATGLIDGITRSDDWQYFMLKGIEYAYGGQSNSILGARVKRTHFMWLMWAKQGVIQNQFNDALYLEAIAFKRECDALGIPMALRLNGTSDMPVESLRLHSIPGKKGKLLIEELGKMGIITYDYTKDSDKMYRWIKESSWKLPPSALKPGALNKFQVTGKAFPSSYYLVFSWSEVNGQVAIRMLRKGANVVMVFRRSVEVTKKDRLALPARAGKKGALPELIRVGDLSRDPADRMWVADIIDGDAHDLRFLDPTALKAKGGRVVGLIAKGGAAKPYTDSERRKDWRHFTSPAVLEEAPRGKGRKAMISIRPNPEKPDDAIVTVDSDLYNLATSFVDGFMITTTAMGT